MSNAYVRVGGLCCSTFSPKTCFLAFRIAASVTLSMLSSSFPSEALKGGAGLPWEASGRDVRLGEEDSP